MRKKLLFSLMLLVTALFSWQSASAAYCNITKKVNESCIDVNIDNVHSHSLQGITIKVGGATVLTQGATTTTFNWLSGSKSFNVKQGEEMEITLTNGLWSKNVWIGFDWNGDGNDFEYVYRVYPETGRVVPDAGTNSVKTVTIPVPADAKVGATRVRFISDGVDCLLKWDETTPMCGTHGTERIGYAGSVHEFGMNIEAGAPAVASDLSFAIPGVSLRLGDIEYTQVATSTNSQGAITYTIDNPAFADIDATTGKVTLKAITGSGFATITATQAAWGSYLQTTASYKMVIENNIRFSVSVSASPAEGGKVFVNEFDDYDNIMYGSTGALTVTPNAGYNFVKWTKDGVDFSTLATCNTDPVKGAVAYTAVFEKQSDVTYDMFAVIAPEEAGSVQINGNVSPADPIRVNAGSEVTFQANLDPKYKLVGWTESLLPVSDQNPYVVESADKDITLIAFCELRSIIDINVSVNNSSLGTAIYTHVGIGDVLEGEDVVFIATPGLNSLFVNWTDADGNELSPLATFTLPAVSADLNIKANFVEKKTAPSSSITFNGTSQYVRIPNSADFKMNNTENLSISMWVKSSSLVLPNARRVFGYRIGSDAEAAYELYALTTGYACTATGVAGSNSNRFIDAVLGGLGGTWTHLAVVFDRTGGNSHAYVNGVVVPLASKPITSAMAITSTRDLLIAAGWNSSGVVSNNFEGDVANVRVYKKALSVGDVAIDASSDYAELPSTIKNSCVAAYKLDNAHLTSTLTDLTGRGNNGTLNGFVTLSNLSFANKTVSFPFGEKEYTQVATSTDSQGAITYSLAVTVGDPDLATINSTTGKVTFNGKIGTAVITATQAAWGSFLQTTATYILNILRNEDMTVYVVASPAVGGVVTITDNSGPSHDFGYIQYGSPAELLATPNSGYSFVRWSKGGVEVSTSAAYTTDPIKEDEITYTAEFSVLGGVEDGELADAKVWFANGMLNIEGINAGDNVKVYGVNGVVVYEGVSGGSTMNVNVSGSGLYMVKINGEVFKAVK